MKLISALAPTALAFALGICVANAQSATANAQDAGSKGQATKKEGSAAMDGKSMKIHPIIDEKAAIAKQLPTYPLSSCPISAESFKAGADGKMPAAPYDLLYKGRLVRLCCKDCVKDFKKNPDTVMAKIDAAITKEQLKNYPLTSCPTSGESFDAKHPAVNFIYGTRLVRFCCNDCVKEFKKDPKEVLAKLDAAYVAEQKPSYEPTTCPVSGEELASQEAPIDLLYGNRLVRLCCKGCVKKFQSDPAKYVAELDATSHPAKGGEAKDLKSAQSQGSKGDAASGKSH